MRNQWTSGRWKLPKASRPAQITNTPINDTWATAPATVLRPTPDTATARSMPCFWSSRTLRAIPPMPAGASLLANDEATWPSANGPAGTRGATAPARPSVAPT